MIRGTTPRITFDVPFNPTFAKRIWITFAQYDKEVFTITEKDCTFSDETIVTTLTQEQTLSLNSNTNVNIQMRVSFANGEKDEALASDIVTTTVQRILKDGEI